MKRRLSVTDLWIAFFQMHRLGQHPGAPDVGLVHQRRRVQRPRQGVSAQGLGPQPHPENLPTPAATSTDAASASVASQYFLSSPANVHSDSISVAFPFVVVVVQGRDHPLNRDHHKFFSSPLFIHLKIKPIKLYFVPRVGSTKFKVSSSQAEIKSDLVLRLISNHYL